MKMNRDTEKTNPGGRIPGNRQEGPIVLGSSGSAQYAESCEGLVEGWPAGPSMEDATVEFRKEVKGSCQYNLRGKRGNMTVHSADDEMEVEGERGKKRKESESPRTVARKLDSDDSGGDEIPPTPRKGKQRRQKDGARSLGTSPPGMEGSPYNPSQTDAKRKKLQEKSSEDLARIAAEWLEELDVLRAKSSNLQGPVSGQMKKRLRGMGKVIEIFMERNEATGDVLFLRERNRELEAQVRASKMSEDRVREDLASAEEEIRKLKREARELRERMGSESPSREADGRTAEGRDQGRTRRGNIRREASSLVQERMRMNAQLEAVKAIDAKMEALTKIREEEKRKIDVMMKQGEGRWAIPSPYPESTGMRPQPTAQRRGGGRLGRGLLSGSETGTTSGGEREGITPGNREVNAAPPGSERGPLIEPWRSNKEYWERRNERQQGRNDDSPAFGGEFFPPLRRKRKQPPAAVTLRAMPGATLAEVVKEARQKVKIKDLGITSPRMRRTRNNDIIIEIPGEDGARKADEFAEKLRGTMEGKAVVSRPTAKAEALLIGIEETVEQAEITAELMGVGNCRLGELRFGPLRPMRSNTSLRTMWIQGPIGAMNRIIERQRITLGWSVIRVVPLRARPVQCFKCWHLGHARGTCKATVDRSQDCFGCGESGHALRECTNPPKCAVCKEEGKDADHRMGNAGSCVNFVNWRSG